MTTAIKPPRVTHRYHKCLSISYYPLFGAREATKSVALDTQSRECERIMKMTTFITRHPSFAHNVMVPYLSSLNTFGTAQTNSNMAGKDSSLSSIPNSNMAGKDSSLLSISNSNMAGKDLSLSSIPFSIATVSVGYSSTPLLSKLYAIAKAGFTGIELAFEDLVSFANIHLLRDVEEDDYDGLAEAASEVRNLCAAQNLKIVILQPFSNFEGWPEHSDERFAAFKKARGWIKIMKGLGTDMLQVGSNDAPIPPLSRSRAEAVRDLKGLSDMLVEEGFKIAYETRSWATVSSTWKDGWEVVKAVDRTNFGLCLDTFQIAAAEYADPTTANGLHSGISPGELGKNFGDSLFEMATTVPAEKVYLLQISDAWRPKAPLSAEMNVTNEKLKAVWNYNYRPLPFDGGYFPVIELARKVLDTGARSWWSVESFDGGREGKEEREPDIEAYCKRAFASLTRLREECLHFGE